jgi:hypothetical protein
MRDIARCFEVKNGVFLIHEFVAVLSAKFRRTGKELLDKDEVELPAKATVAAA